MLAWLLFFSVGVRGQGGTPVTGVILDEKGAPLQGVSVTVQGTNTGTTTDSLGHFTIRAAKGATLIISYIKYGTQEVLVKDQRVLSINMSPLTTNMNDVVVIGYGTQRKATLTGSVAQINGAEIVTTKNENVELHAGNVPGEELNGRQAVTARRRSASSCAVVSSTTALSRSTCTTLGTNPSSSASS